MESIEKRINNILKHLEQVNDDLLALSDDIWLSIDHNDTKAMEEGVVFKSEYNKQLADFGKLSDKIAELVTEFTGTSPEYEEAGWENNKENDRIIRELDKNTKHYLSEDLTYKRPYGFSIKGKAFINVNNWRKVYELFLNYLQKNEKGFGDLIQNKKFISKRGTKNFSATGNELRAPRMITSGFYAETNLSANHLSGQILKLIDHFGYSIQDFVLYLREDRDFKA